MIYPNNIEQKIDFTVIRAELMQRCSSPLGRERVEAMQMAKTPVIIQPDWKVVVASLVLAVAGVCLLRVDRPSAVD